MGFFDSFAKAGKQLATIGICFIMLFSFSGCGQTDSTPEPETVTPTPQIEDSPVEDNPEEDVEIADPAKVDNGFSDEANILIDMGLVPEEITQDPEAFIKWSQMAVLISNVVEYCDESLTEQWKEIAEIAFTKEEEILTAGGAAAIYEAACVLGLGADSRAYWHEANASYNDFVPFSDYVDVFPNFQQESPIEAHMGQPAGWNYMTGSMFYALGLASSEDPTPFFGLPKGEKRL